MGYRETGAANQLIAMVMACASAWMEAALSDPAGGPRWVIYDEAWRLLRQPALLARMHAVTVEALPGPGHRQPDDHPSPLRPRSRRQRRLRSPGSRVGPARRLLNQDHLPAKSSEAPHTAEVLGLSVTERNELPDLQRGERLWRVGQRAFVVRHPVRDGELELFDTNSHYRDCHRPFGPTGRGPIPRAARLGRIARPNLAALWRVTSL